ncbi:fumarylacetoacetate hydrolase family protein [Nocardia nova]|uniref:fumarylacetoacetate hydrolase family protein n=1 Tax=Nocardia nova TaxID=37330 RepID=UPI00046D31C1|nr:fumarylacetoacetate hydrolase family protein [Nocardia nova]
MKLVGIRIGGVDRVGRIDDDRVYPLTSTTEFWSDPYRYTAESETAGKIGLDRTDFEFIPIVPASARVLCIGLNYRAHADEGGFTPPDSPTVFGRWTASLSVGDAPVRVPHGEAGLDWEGEVAAYIGAEFATGDPEQARRAVLGYSTFNDLTARHAQKLTSQWTLGKNADRSGPLGPLVTADEVGDLRTGLSLQTRVNGTVVQDASTASMIFDVGQLISHISQTLTLHPGDIVATGTPSGVGYVRNPPWLLNAGDVVEVEVERLGVLRTPIAAPAPARRASVRGEG